MSYFEAFILSFIEGLTEFLPVSSTGHLIIASQYMQISEPTFVNAFNIIIQSGAIMAVLVLYWKRFFQSVHFYIQLLVAFLPAAIIGLLVKDQIDQILESVTIVAWALIIGGLVLIYLDKKLQTSNEKLSTFPLIKYFYLGLIQCLAFIPGVSRSAATIMGGMFLGLSKKESAEFSFFLAVPTLLGATIVKLLKLHSTFTSTEFYEHLGLLLFGCILSFVFALIAIKFFIKLISEKGLWGFGIYRIILGAIVLWF